MLSAMAMPVAFSVAFGSSLKKIIAKTNVVPDAIILQVRVLAMCLFLEAFGESPAMIKGYLSNRMYLE